MNHCGTDKCSDHCHVILLWNIYALFEQLDNTINSHWTYSNDTVEHLSKLMYGKNLFISREKYLLSCHVGTLYWEIFPLEES